MSQHVKMVCVLIPILLVGISPGEALAQERERIRISSISLVWDEGHRTLDNVLAALERAGRDGADLAVLPENCVDAPPEALPGPISTAIAARAREYGMYVVGTLREAAEGKVFHTAFLCNRDGDIVGVYRKSHKLPYEDMDLGDEIPVFQSDFGGLGILIGSDHYFQDIVMRHQRLGARTIVWCTSPFPVRDEYPLDSLICGRASDMSLNYVVARYAGREGYGGYDTAYSWLARWPLGRAMVIDRRGHQVATTDYMGGVATATMPAWDLHSTIRERGTVEAGAPPVAPDVDDVEFVKRQIRLCLVEPPGGIEALMRRLDMCGAMGADIVGLWEYVFYNSEEEVEQFRERNMEYMRMIADKAREHGMYIVIGGELYQGYNEAIIFDRQGQELGRYIKVLQTTPKEWKTYRKGEETPVFVTDFGRIAVKICLDTYAPHLDYDYGLQRADLVFFPTQDAGPYDYFREMRHRRRAIDNGFYFCSTNGGYAQQSMNRSFVIDPWGCTVAASLNRTVPSQVGGGDPLWDDEEAIITCVLDLDRRPAYFEWPADVKAAGPYPDGYQQNRRPVVAGDLRETIIANRRPQLYSAAW